MTRVILYVDGFNLYHAIADLRVPHLKWLSLHELGRRLIQQRTEELVCVTYFSAVATHLAQRDPSKIVRHQAYVSALEATGVECCMGRFKLKNARCRGCGHRWQTPEEKETDVAIAVRMVRDAFQDRFDTCYLVSGDTDLTPAIRLIQQEFPQKRLVTVSTPHRPHSAEILTLANRKTKITVPLLERCLLPETINAPNGSIIRRPSEYDPPA
jgi:uncharacterized LabA/DUF88 family protein